MRTVGVALTLLAFATAGCELFPSDDDKEPESISVRLVIHWSGGASPTLDTGAVDTAHASVWTVANGNMADELLSEELARPADDAPSVIEVPDLSPGGRYQVIVAVGSAESTEGSLGGTHFDVTLGQEDGQELHVSPEGPASTIVPELDIIAMGEGGVSNYRSWALNSLGHYLVIPADQWKAWSDDPQVCPAWDGGNVAAIAEPNVITQVHFAVGDASAALVCGSKPSPPPNVAPVYGRWESSPGPAPFAYEISNEWIRYFEWEGEEKYEDWVLKKEWSPENGDVIASSKYGLAFACRDGRVEHWFRSSGSDSDASVSVDGGVVLFHPND